MVVTEEVSKMIPKMKYLQELVQIGGDRFHPVICGKVDYKKIVRAEQIGERYVTTPKVRTRLDPHNPNGLEIAYHALLWYDIVHGTRLNADAYELTRIRMVPTILYERGPNLYIQFYKLKHQLEQKKKS
jgi:hypothetical protein